MRTDEKTFSNVPVLCALEPVQDVSAPGVVNLVKGVSIRLLDGDSIAEKEPNVQTLVDPR